MNKKLFFLQILVIYSLIGCATEQQVPSTPTQSISTPVMTTLSKSIAEQNGFSDGKWMNDCKNKLGQVQEISHNEKNIIVKIYENNELVEVNQLYEAISPSNGILNIKTRSTNKNGEYITIQKIGFTGLKRMIFDSTSLPLTGSLKSKEIVTARDGFQVAQSSDMQIKKLAPMKSFEKCN